MDYLNKKEGFNKRDLQEINQSLAKQIEIEDKKNTQIHYENFYTTSKPVSLKEARVKNKLDKTIEGHIIVCGIVKGIKNLILPLRSRFQSGQKRPIVILSNDSLGDEGMNADTFIWSEINRFEEIYLIRGSALNPADLEKARVKRARAIIILSKSYESIGGKISQNNLDADAIFMYKTIEADYQNVVIVTELASVSAIAFLVQGKEETINKDDYYQSKPFAAGEIFVSHLLDSLMCQAYYAPKITEILEQMIIGAANTPESIMKHYRRLNLSKCSLNLIEIPKDCTSMQFSDVFEYCVNRHQIPIAVYKRHTEEKDPIQLGNNKEEDQDQGLGVKNEEKSQKKSYMWLHPPRNIELNIYDELFVLCENSESVAQ